MPFAADNPPSFQEPLVILLIEDDPAHAEIVRRNLERCGIANALQHAKDGQEALDYLFHQGRYTDLASAPRPQVILLDLHLPKIEGLDVLRQIRASEELNGVPVVVLTTSASEPDVEQAYAYRASSYLVKPLDFDKFTRLIESFSHYWLTWNRYPR
ncbi:response regulator [Imhoffiella purpurea]|uniref:response regulator n=1 Tax=Imhoffiella purpurea TaxID=1249627 RepID=UPI00069436AF|nr:response regulator [Imhoffiella purpurea]